MKSAACLSARRLNDGLTPDEKELEALQSTAMPRCGP
jgi:hypothetical protein